MIVITGEVKDPITALDVISTHTQTHTIMNHKCSALVVLV